MRDQQVLCTKTSELRARKHDRFFWKLRTPRPVVAAELGISQPQLANALARRFGLSPVAAARLLEWLRRAAA